MLDVFMDLAERAVFDLDSRVAGSLRFAQTHGVAVGVGWHAGVALLREDPVVTEILLHYLRDSRALNEFDLGWEPHYDGSQQRADLLLTSKPADVRHLIEVKWWWWSKDKDAVRRDAAKLRAARTASNGDVATGHVLIVTTGSGPGDWRDESGKPDAKRVFDWFEHDEIREIWEPSLGAPHIRVFPTSATIKQGPSREFVGALILVPVAENVRVASHTSVEAK
jgi:hypothetical protein